MKNKVLFTLAAVGSILCGCTKEQALNYNRPFSKVEFRDAFKPTASNVYMNEDGQLIKINDPDDPTINVLQELRMSESVAVMFYSDAKTSGFAEQLQLSTTGYPLKAPAGKITWSSSNTDAAVVDQNGLVTAVKAGISEITATSEAGLTATCRVVVVNNNVLMSEASKSAKKILAKQNSTDFEPVTTVKVIQDLVDTTTKNGVVSSQSRWVANMWASTNNAYFRYTSTDEDIKTSGGSIVPSTSAYIFYTTADYLSYIFCNSNGKSNYMSLDQAYLVDKGKSQFDALGEILQSFFVAGSSIMTNQLSDVLGQKQLNNGYSGAKYKGSLGEDSGVFAFTTSSSSGGTISASQEDEMGIPAGTQVTVTDDYRYLFENDLLAAKVLNEKLEYTIDGVNYVENYNVHYYYQGRNVELFWPERANYSQVDSIFDL